MNKPMNPGLLGTLAGLCSLLISFPTAILVFHTNNFLGFLFTIIGIYTAVGVPTIVLYSRQKKFDEYWKSVKETKQD